MLAPVRRCDFIFDQRVDRLGVRHTQQCFCQTHQRNTLVGGQPILCKKHFHQPRIVSGSDRPHELGRTRLSLRTNTCRNRSGVHQLLEYIVVEPQRVSADFVANLLERRHLGPVRLLCLRLSEILRARGLNLEKIQAKRLFLATGRVQMKLKSSGDSQLDYYDIAILESLSRDGRLPVTDLARLIGLSKTPTQARVKRLQIEGYITGFRAVLNPGMLGQDHVAFVEVKLTDTTEGALDAFNLAVQKMPEIEECHMIAGAFDYLLKIRTTSIKTYRQVLGEKISAMPFVGNTSTHVSMEAVKDLGF